MTKVWRGMSSRVMGRSNGVHDNTSTPSSVQLRLLSRGSMKRTASLASLPVDSGDAVGVNAGRNSGTLPHCLVDCCVVDFLCGTVCVVHA